MKFLLFFVAIGYYIDDLSKYVEYNDKSALTYGIDGAGAVYLDVEQTNGTITLKIKLDREVCRQLIVDSCSKFSPIVERNFYFLLVYERTLKKFLRRYYARLLCWENKLLHDVHLHFMLARLNL